MRGWKEITLRDSYIVTNAKTLNKDYPFSEIIYLDTGSITRGKVENYQKTSLKDAPSRAKRLLSNNDIIYSSVRPANRHYGFFPKPISNLVVSTGFIVITCNEEKLFPLFLYYYLAQDHIVDELHSIAEGSTSAYPSLLASDIESMKISIPATLQEQRAIAAVLSNLDDKIELLQRQNATLEAMAEALFKQWFVVARNEEWEERCLGDLVSITRGASPRPIIKFIDNGTVPWIKIADATSSTSFFINKTKEFIIDEGVKKSVEVFPGDLILSNSATCGQPFIVNIYGCIHDGWLLFRNFEKLPKYILLFLLRYISRELNQIADGSVQDNLNTDLLKNFPIRLPGTKQLIQFNNIIQKYVQKILSNQTQIRTLEKLRDTLLPKLMSGEVRVAH